METLYLVDIDDNVLGPIDRSRAHREQLLHRAGMVFLSRSDGKILIQHRSESKETFPGCYDASVTFHVTYGETYDAAALRELREEAGVSAPLTFLGKFTHHDPPEHEVVAVYSCKSDETVRVDPAESEGFEFLEGEEIDEIVRTRKITPWFRDGWKLAAGRLGRRKS
jgi:isopentenyl-diphosphate delta-isomerase type 1